MNVLLVYPSTLDAAGRPVKYRKAFLPPLNMAILAELTPRHHRVRIVNDLVEEIDFNGPWDVVGITAMTTQIGRAYRIADEFRRRGARVILGGAHPSALPEEARQHADAVVIGEAEDLWESILADCEARRLREIYSPVGAVDMRRLIVPRWESANLGIYPRRLGARLPLMPIFTTRGCPFGCKFCAVTRTYGKEYRVKPIANVLTEIDRCGAREYFFVDDNIGFDPQYSRDLFLAIRGRRINWFSQISSTVLKHPELIDLAGQSGCFYLFVGVESLNSASLASVNKRFNKVDQYEELIHRMRRAGIAPFFSFIFGFDEDGVEQFRVTLEFIRKHRVGFAAFWLLTPLPGTELRAEMLRDGRLLSSDWSMYDGTHMVFQPRNIAPAQLEEAYWNAYRAYYSLGNIVSGVVENVRRSRRPLEELFRSIFYQGFFRRKARSREHPFSGGLLRRA